MQLGLRLCIKARGAAQQLTIYGSYNPTPVNLMAIKVFGLNAVQEHSFKFLRHELPIRLANILQEINLLPPSLLETLAVRTVVGWYEKSFEELVRFKDSDGSDYSVLSGFTDTLDEIRERHTNVVETMAKGILTIKKRADACKLINEEQLQYFLDRFYTSRISIRMLIHNHILLFGPHLNEHRLIGCIDPNCDVHTVVQDAYYTASKLCLQHYNRCPPEMNVKIIDSLSPMNRRDHLEILYVPTHLHHMLFEIMKNAMRATMEFQEQRGAETPSPVEVLVIGGKEDVTFKISDRGGGIPRSMMSEIFKYTFTTARKDDESDSDTSGSSIVSTAPVKLAGYGYGLPLSRLYARYLSGNLEICSTEGYGTCAYIILKRRAADAEESIPIFNKTCADRYTQNGDSKAVESDWLGMNNTPRTASG